MPRNDNVRALFFIAVLTLFLGYYVAVEKEAPVLFQGITNAVVQFWYAITSKNSKGQFASYSK